MSLSKVIDVWWPRSIMVLFSKIKVKFKNESQIKSETECESQMKT